MAVGVGLGLWRQGPVVEARLADGSMLGVVSVQYGRRHVDPFLKLWERWAGFLPVELATRFKVRQPDNLNRCPTQTALSIWLTTTTPIEPGSGQLGVRVTDDDGLVGGQNDEPPSVFLVPEDRRMTNGRYQGHVVSVFPRRARTLRVQVFDQSQGVGQIGNVLQEFRIPNPSYPLKAPPLVATVGASKSADGHFGATLDRFDVSEAHAGAVPGRDDGPSAWFASFGFTVAVDGQTTTNWIADRIVAIQDGTGNHTLPGFISPLYFFRPGDFRMIQPWGFPTDEPSRVSVEFVQVAGFASNAVFHFRNVPIATDSRTMMPDRQLRAQSPFGILRFGPAMNSYQAEVNEGKGLDLVIQTPAIVAGQNWHGIILKAVDSDGYALTVNGPATFHDRYLQFWLQSRTNAVAADIWLAAAPRQVLEFVAQPRVQRSKVRPAAAPGRPAE